MLLMTPRQPRHCRHTLVAFAFTAVAEMMMPCTFTRRDTCSDCGGGGNDKMRSNGRRRRRERETEQRCALQVP